MHVRAVNGHVTRRAALIVRIDHAMRRMVRESDAALRSHTEIAIARVALQASLGDRGPRQ